MYLKIALIIFLAFIAEDTCGQFWKKKKKQRMEVQNNTLQPTSLNPYAVEKKEYAPRERSQQRASRGPTYGLEQEYYERMGKLQKEREKMERLMEKPQYSDPLYFGHKRPPKKRKPSKMKFCKECGIRH